MFLCAKHAEALGVSVACILTVDSDIAICALYFALQISISVHIESGTSNQRRCIDIRNIVSEIREEACLALPALHLFTGNDYTGAFYGTGKVKALNILIRSEDRIKTFNAIGDQFTLNAELFPLVEQFVCELYGLS